MCIAKQQWRWSSRPFPYNRSCKISLQLLKIRSNERSPLVEIIASYKIFKSWSVAARTNRKDNVYANWLLKRSRKHRIIRTLLNLVGGLGLAITLICLSQRLTLTPWPFNVINLISRRLRFASNVRQDDETTRVMILSISTNRPI